MASSQDVRTIQNTLRKAGYDIAVDGILGPQTAGAMASARRRFGWFKQFEEVIDVQPDDSRDVLPGSKLLELAKTVNMETGVPVTYLMETFKTENTPSGDGVVVEFDGKYKGLGQFDATTWGSVMDVPFTEVTNHLQSARAIAQLYLANRGSFWRYFPGVKYTNEIAYLYHNQGAGAARQFLLTGDLRWPKQSSVALMKFADARGQYYDNSRGTIT